MEPPSQMAPDAGERAPPLRDFEKPETGETGKTKHTASKIHSMHQPAECESASSDCQTCQDATVASGTGAVQRARVLSLFRRLLRGRT